MASTTPIVGVKTSLLTKEVAQEGNIMKLLRTLLLVAPGVGDGDFGLESRLVNLINSPSPYSSTGKVGRRRGMIGYSIR